MGEDIGPVVCGSCGARLSVGALTEDEHEALRDQYTYQEFLEELLIDVKTTQGDTLGSALVVDGRC